jgi:hypothetical protein
LSSGEVLFAFHRFAFLACPSETPRIFFIQHRTALGTEALCVGFPL